MGTSWPAQAALEDAGAIALQVGLDPLQRVHGVVEAGEMLLDGGDDAVLLGEGREGEWKCLDYCLADIDICSITNLGPRDHFVLQK